jgi:mRNA interferase MazF
MNVARGEIWMANFNPVKGSEQAGTRPVLIFQNDVLAKYTTTILAIPLTTNLRRASLPSCVKISQGEGGLINDSVALCHQMKAVDKVRLIKKMGKVSDQTLTLIESCTKFTMGIS